MLWIAFKLLSLQGQRQPVSLKEAVETVVNCFQITIFAGAKTTSLPILCACWLLWIAFKLLSLQGQRQLTNYYTCHNMVVNCFQITIFAGAKTTCHCTPLLHLRCELLSNYYLCRGKDNDIRQFRSSVQLWIAFKLLSLQGQRQHEIGCVLVLFVVNCFQITIFAGAKTTAIGIARGHYVLWIAFKLLSLQGQRQLHCRFSSAGSSCELLSNYYLCRGKDNILVLYAVFIIVVNCFQITIFAGAKTTGFNIQLFWDSLWIAFKLLSLQGQRQLIT